MGVLIYVAILVAAYFRPKSDRLAKFICIFMVILFGFSTNSADHQNYMNAYQILPLGIHLAYEPLYELVLTICRIAGLEYGGFRLVLGTICVVLTYLTVKKLTHYPAMALALFLSYPMMGFVVMMRGAVASAIVMYSLTFLLRSKDKPELKFAIGVLIATLFHYSSVVYFAILLVRLPISKKYLFYASAGAGLVLAILWHGTDLFYTVLSKITTSQKVLAWFDPNSTMNKMGFGGIAFVSACLLGNIVLSYLSRSAVRQRGMKDVEVYRDTSELALRVSIVILLLIPVLFVHITYLRLFEEIILLTICSCAETLSAPRKPYEKFLPLSVLGMAGQLTVMILVENMPLVQYTIYYYFMPLIENYIF